MFSFCKNPISLTSKVVSFLLLIALLLQLLSPSFILAETVATKTPDQALEEADPDVAIEPLPDPAVDQPPADNSGSQPNPSSLELNRTPVSLAELLADLPDPESFMTLTLDQQVAVVLPLFQLLSQAESAGQLSDREGAGSALESLFSGLDPQQEADFFVRVYQALGLDYKPAEESLPETIVYTAAAPLFKPAELRPDPPLPMAQAVGLTGQGLGSSDPYNLSNKLVLNKKVEKVSSDPGNKEYELTLEVFTTEKLFQGTERIHASDIILLIDESQQMAALSEANNQVKAAVTNFIDQVKADAGPTEDHRIGYIAFSGRIGPTHKLSNDYEAVKSDFLSNYSTHNIRQYSTPSNALAKAKDFFTQAPPLPGGPQRNRVLILVTASNPSAYLNQFDIGKADAAVKMANQLKKSGTTVYSIGLFNGANNSVTHGDQHQHAGYDFSSYSTGLPNSYWQKSLFSGRDLVDLPAANRFLNYLSSNFYDPDQARATLGLQFGAIRDGSLPIFQRSQNRYTIKHSMPFMGTRGYYLTGGIGDLNTGLASIASQIERPPAEFGNQIRLQDTLSDYFSLAGEFTADEIKVYTQKCTGKDTVTGEYLFEANLTELTEAGIQKSFTNQSGNPDGSGAIHDINVSGFDFDQNYCSEQEKSDGSYGKKLVIKFKALKEGAGNFGGGKFPTNIYPSSGAYIGESHQAVAYFPECTLDEPIHFAVYKENLAYGMYLGNLLRPGRAIPFANLSTPGTDDFMYPDGEKNKYVDIYYTFKQNGLIIDTFKIPAASSASLAELGQNKWLGTYANQPLKPDLDSLYEVEVRMLAKGSPFDPADPPPLGEDAETRVGIYVYHPTVELADLNLPAGGIVDLRKQVNQGGEEKIWTLFSDPANPDNIPLPDSADRPKLVFEYFTADGQKITNPEAYPVNEESPIKLKIGLDLAEEYNQLGLADGEEVTGQTYYKKNSQEGTFTVPDPHFTIFIKANGSITINNKLPTPTIYLLKGPDGTAGPGLKIVVPANGSIKVTDLPYGNYELSQLATSAWQYDPAQTASVSLTATINAISCDFENSLKPFPWFRAHALKPNPFTNPESMPSP